MGGSTVITVDATANHEAAVAFTIMVMAAKHLSNTCSVPVKANTGGRLWRLSTRPSAQMCEHMVVLNVEIGSTSDPCIL